MHVVCNDSGAIQCNDTLCIVQGKRARERVRKMHVLQTARFTQGCNSSRCLHRNELPPVSPTKINVKKGEGGGECCMSLYTKIVHAHARTHTDTLSLSLCLSHIHTYKRARAHARIPAHIHTHTHTHTFYKHTVPTSRKINSVVDGAHTHTHTHEHIHIDDVHAHMHIHTCTYTHTHTILHLHCTCHQTD